MIQSDKLKNQIEELLDTLRDIPKIDRACVALGIKLDAVRAGKYFVEWGYYSFSDYLAYVRKRTGLGKTQIYSYMSNVEQLGSLIGIPALEKLGNTKANILRNLVSRQGRINKKWTLPEDIVSFGMDKKTSIDAFKSRVFELYPTSGEQEVGTKRYTALGGVFLTSKEYKVFNDSVSAIASKLGVQDKPKHIRMKEVIFYLINSQD